jgi:two-component system response regulator PilR (NtrC family)
VLVIEDEPGVRLVVCDLLASLGWDADEASDGAAGMALFERHPYDLVVTDLRMPRLTGWDVVEAARARVPTIPIIMMSGFATGDDLRRARRAGIPLLEKPFSLSELRRVLREALTSGGIRPDIRTPSDVLRKPLTEAREERHQGPEMGREPA